jgi:tetrapyrrole methylase family protein/MazG family protein
MAEKKGEGVMDIKPLDKVIKTLRAPHGCPWDRIQTHRSMRRELVEEVYELLEAIDEEDTAGMREELGDVMMQVVFHARLAEEEGLFTMQDVIDDVVKKLIHRHPHVYGTIEVTDTGEVLKNWEAIKAGEKKERTSALDGIARGLPALMRAYKLSARAAGKGFAWPEAEDARKKVMEELKELEAAKQAKNMDAMEDELGDVFFALSVYARMLGLEPETALNRANNKFEKRFRCMEKILKSEHRDMEKLSISELLQLWKRAKAENL